MSWDKNEPTSHGGGAGTTWVGYRARRWGVALLGAAVLALVFLAGLLLSGPSPSPPRAETRTAPERLLSLLAEVESAERGYLVSGREEDARAHEAAAREIETILPQLVGPQPSSGVSSSALEPTVGEILSSSRETVRLRRERGLEAASARAATLAVPPDRLRRLLGEMAAGQRAGLDVREAELRGQLFRRTALVLGAGLAAILAAGLAFVAFSRPRNVAEFVEVGPPEPLPAIDTAGRVGDVLQALLDTLDDAVVVVDEHGRTVASNPAADAALGLGDPRPRADGPFGLYLADGTGSAKESPILRALKGDVVRGATFFVGPSKNEASRRVSVNARPVRSGAGRQLRGAVLVLTDITDLRKREAAARESEQKFAGLFENAPFGIVSAGLDGRIHAVNPAFCRLLGLGAEQLVGRETASLARRPDLEPEAALLRELVAGGRGSYQIEKRCRTSEGVTRSLRWTVSIVRDAEGAVLSTVAGVEDMTELKRLEWTNRRSQDILRSVLDALPVGVWIVDRGGSVRLNNPAGQMIWANKGDVLRFPDGEYKGWWADTGKRIEPNEWGALQTIESGQPLLDRVIEIQRFDGTFRKLLTSAIPFRRLDGSVAGAILIQQDITKEGWTSEQRLRLETELHQAVLQASTLRGLLPVCPLCEKKREEPAYWKRVRSWIGEHLSEMREHACRECQSRAYDLSGDAVEDKPATRK